MQTTVDTTETSPTGPPPAAQELLSAIPAALYITDRDGRITLFNEPAAELWGRRPELGELWCGSWKILNSDGSVMPHAECPMADTVRSGEPTTGRHIVVERPDGTRAVVAPSPQPLLDSTGQVIGAINMLIDVTTQREAAAALEKAEAQAQRLARELADQYALTKVLSTSRSLLDAAPQALEILCQAAGAQVAGLWMLGGRAKMKPVCVVTTDKPRFAEFVNGTANLSLRLDKGLPGRVVLSGIAVWEVTFADSAKIERRTAAESTGLVSAAAFPVRLREDLPVRGVIELFFAERRERDDRLVNFIMEAGLRLGAFADRLDLEHALWESQQRTGAAF